ncbi:MAG: M14 family metallopeptidase [Cytophagales bacterium]|nr:M14 family metallopeptidase [Bernardetiaceae bacterium]MDW8205972.1 M14 family metallopeptidase [Cytophagales bacterium]
MNRKSFVAALQQQYNTYREPYFTYRRFKHADLQPLIAALSPDKGFAVKQLGFSTEKRVIHHIQLGKGATQVMLWSQMHGDEATATMALFDIFRFFSTSDELDSYRKVILDNLSLHFVPMLNPDGAEVFKRRTALDIDMNRDALRLVNPESRLLKGLRDELNADFGFNLHDQHTRYTAYYTPKPATISFLAPAYNVAKEVNPVRERAMRLIAAMNEDLQGIIPGQVAKYNDEFEPRAFGDNMQKWGTSTILIESGGYPNDPEKMYVRQLNFIAILSALYAIAQKEYEQYTTEQYWAIPDNRTQLRHLLLRNVELNLNGASYRTDISYDVRERTKADNRSFYYESFIDDLGDLSTLYGYREIDCTHLQVSLGKVYPEEMYSLEQIRKLNFSQLIAEGYTALRYKGQDWQEKDVPADIPLNLLRGNHTQPDDTIGIERNPDLVLLEAGKVRYLIINGFVREVNAASWLGNALCY